jgi:hypothetical protein
MVFDRSVPHGGLVDRFKGIVSFYAYAKKFNYEFKIYHKHPYDLDFFLAPNSYDWRAKPEDLHYNLLDTDILYLMERFDIDPGTFLSGKKNKKFFVYSNVNYLHKIFDNETKSATETIWGQLFNELFRPTQTLQIEVGKVIGEIEKPFISFHTRFTSILGDFTDVRKKELSPDKQMALVRNCVEIINQHANQHKGDQILVFSDSIKFLSYIKQHTDYTVLDGNPLHIDGKNVVTGAVFHMKTFIDFFVLSKSEKIFLISTGPMYNSNFSRFASYLEGCEFKKIHDHTI